MEGSFKTILKAAENWRWEDEKMVAGYWFKQVTSNEKRGTGLSPFAALLCFQCVAYLLGKFVYVERLLEECLAALVEDLLCLAVQAVSA